MSFACKPKQSKLRGILQTMCGTLQALQHCVKTTPCLNSTCCAIAAGCIALTSSLLCWWLLCLLLLLLLRCVQPRYGALDLLPARTSCKSSPTHDFSVLTGCARRVDEHLDGQRSALLF
jgi:hypothetical protein